MRPVVSTPTCQISLSGKTIFPGNCRSAGTSWTISFVVVMVPRCSSTGRTISAPSGLLFAAAGPLDGFGWVLTTDEAEPRQPVAKLITTTIAASTHIACAGCVALRSAVCDLVTGRGSFLVSMIMVQGPRHTPAKGRSGDNYPEPPPKRFAYRRVIVQHPAGEVDQCLLRDRLHEKCSRYRLPGRAGDDIVPRPDGAMCQRRCAPAQDRSRSAAVLRQAWTDWLRHQIVRRMLPLDCGQKLEGSLESRQSLCRSPPFVCTQRVRRYLAYPVPFVSSGWRVPHRLTAWPGPLRCARPVDYL